MQSTRTHGTGSKYNANIWSSSNAVITRTENVPSLQSATVAVAAAKKRKKNSQLFGSDWMSFSFNSRVKCVAYYSLLLVILVHLFWMYLVFFYWEHRTKYIGKKCEVDVISKSTFRYAISMDACELIISIRFFFTQYEIRFDWTAHLRKHCDERSKKKEKIIDWILCVISK